jgi:hypothetical protein
VKDLIKKVTRSQDDRKFRMQWFGDIYNGVRGFDVYGPIFDVYGSMRAANNALALITYMAMNTGTLSFCVPMPVMLELALQRSWGESEKEVDGSYPFHKLKNLHMAVNVDITMLKSLEHISVRGANRTKV